MHQTLILGSSSTYRKKLLERLNLSFTCHSPNINEAPKINETPKELVKRLSIEKAQAVYLDRKSITKQKNALIITSDQVAVLDNKVLGKPLSEQNAIKQLSKFSGKKVTFLTGLCLLDETDGTYQYQLNHFHVYFRELSKPEIAQYIKQEQPLNCAGSFKAEGLGISLFEKMEGNDPNSLIGLPLISLCEMLREKGVNPIDQ